MAAQRPGLIHAAKLSAAALIVAAGVLAVAWVLVKLAVLSLAIFGALILACLLWPVARRLERWRVPRSLAAFLSLILAVGLVGGAAAWIIPTTISQVSANRDQLKANATQLVEQVSAKLPGEGGTMRDLGARASEFVKQHRQRLVSGVASGVVTAAEIGGGLLLALVLGFFFIRDGERLATGVLSLVREEKRRVLVPALLSAWHTLRKWVRGAAIIAFIDAVGIGVGLAILGVPLALPLAVLTFMAGFIPVVGATVAGGLAVLVAWATGGTTDALIALAIVIAVQQFEGNVLEPVVMGHAVPMHPAVVLIVVTAGTLLGGIAGAFAAVPLAAVTVAFLKEVHARTEPARPAHRWAPADLEEHPPAH